MKNLILNIISTALLTFILGCGCSTKKINDSIDSGKKVVAIAESFKEKKGYYPKDLNELENFYKSKLPKPSCGKGLWVYSLFEENNKVHFSLKVYEPNEQSVTILYVSNREGWLVDTK